MKSTTLLRIGILPFLALLVFACKKEVQTSSTSTSFSSLAKGGQSTPQQGPALDWTIDIQVTKNACDEQVFTLTVLNNGGQAVDEGTGDVEFTIADAGGIVETHSGNSGMVVTTHLAEGVYSLSATVTNGAKLKGASSIPDITVESCGCPYKGLDELTCDDLNKEIEIGGRTYSPEELCELLNYNRGNHGYGALVRLAQAIMVAKWNGFRDDNAYVKAADDLMTGKNALDPDHQASVVDQYGAPEKGHVQDLVKCE